MNRYQPVLSLAGTVVVILITACEPSPRPTHPATPQAMGMAPALAEAPPADRPSYFGLNGTKIFHIPDDAETVAQRIEWMKELGVHWDRSDLWWHVVEPEMGRFDFARADFAFDTLDAHGIQWYPILCYGASWYHHERTAPIEDEDFEAFADYVYRTVARYKDRCKLWEMWNEPNIPNFWSPQPDPAAYVRLMKLSYASMKRADPEAQMCAPAIAPLGAWDRQFVEAMYRLGGKDYFDIFDYHYYRNYAPEEEVPTELAEIKAVMRRYGDGDKPIQISESGVSSVIDGEINYDLQAAYVVRNQLLCLALGVDRFFYFDLQNWYDDKPETWDSQLGLVTAAGEKKPAFYAYRTLIDQVNYKDFVGRVTSLGKAVEGVLIHDPKTGEYSLALWLAQNRGRREVVVACGGDSGRVVSPNGHTTVVPTDETAQSESARSVTVTAGPAPIFVNGVDGRAYLPDAGVRFEHTLTILNPGESASLPIHVDERIIDPVIRVTSVRADPGVSWDGDQRRVSCDSTARPGRKSLSATVELTHGPNADRRTVQCGLDAEIEVVPTVKISERVALNGDRLTFVVAVSNQSPKAKSGTVRLVQDIAGASTFIDTATLDSISPHQSAEVAFVVPASLVRDSVPGTAWAAEFAAIRSRPRKVYHSRLALDDILVDAKLSDWQNAPWVRLGKREQVVRGVGPWHPDDASASVYLRISETALYVAADVTDDDPMHNREQPARMWKGDSLEIFIAPAGPSGRTVLGAASELQIGIAPSQGPGKGPVAYQFHRDVVLEEALVAARSRSDGYTIEAAIPLKSLGIDSSTIQPGAIVGFDVTLNDLDAEDWAPAGNDPGCRLVWNGTARNWIDPSHWGLCVLHGPTG